MSSTRTGCARMVSAWKPKSSTTVSSRPMMEVGLSRWPRRLDAGPRQHTLGGDAGARAGTTTKITTEAMSVSQGTSTAVTPSSRAAMGAKANTMMRSFTDTCTRV
jgi:hypothetical protein